MSAVEIQEKLKGGMSAKEAIKFKLEKFKNRTQINPSVKNRENKNMTPKQLVG